MANQRQSFFRFSWFGQPNPTPQSRPTQETRTPAPMTAALAGQLPAFSPSGIAPTQPRPSQPSKTEPQDQPASQPPSESRVTSQPPSPTRAPKESRATSQPPSPSRAPKESHSTSQPPSPSRALKESRATSQPSSPSRPKTQIPSSPSRASSGSPSKSPSKPQPDSETASSQPQSPSRETTSSQVTSPSRLRSKAELLSETMADKEGSQPQSSETQREEKVAESQPPLQQPQMKTEVAPDKTKVAKDESPKKTTSQADNGGEKVTAQASDSAATPSPSQQEDKAAISQPALTQVAKTESPMKTTSQTDNDGEKGTAQASQQDDKAVVSQPALQESQPKIEITPEQTSVSPLKTTSQDEDDRKATKAPALSPKEVAESTGDQKTLSKLEGESKPERAEEEEKTVEELPKEEKTRSPAYEQPVQKPVTQHIPTVRTGRRKHTRDPAIVAFRQEKWPQKQETSDKENKVATTTTTTSYIGRQIKTVSSSGNTSNTSFHKPCSSAADEQAPRQKEIKEDISKLVHKLTTEHQLVESPVTVITLTGENRGASMNVSSEPAEKEESIHIHRGYKLNPDDSAETTTDGEVSNTQGRRFKDHLSREAPPVKAYANSNVQSINNSIVFNASVNVRNPGIHLQFSQDDAEPTGINGRSESHQASRAEISITPSEKLTHEHTVKRRCLRGLFLESSDSEPDNPEKPRRHGCRYGCFENKKDKEFGA